MKPPAPHTNTSQVLRVDIIFGVALLRQLGIKGVISFRPLGLIVPETDAGNLAGGSYVIPGQ
jgi:hypothetical protein